MDHYDRDWREMLWTLSSQPHANSMMKVSESFWFLK